MDHDQSQAGHAFDPGGSVAQHAGCRRRRRQELRWDSLRASLDAAEPELTQLASEIEVKVYTFDAEAHAVDVIESPTHWPAKADGSQTAIGWVLEDALRRETGKRLAGVVLLSDGAQRVLPAKDVPPQTPARRLADLGFRLYAVPFGQARALDQARDVALSDMRAPQVVFVKNELNVEAVAQLEGFVGQDIVVQLAVETAPGKMEVVDSQRIRSDKNGDRLPVKTKFIPDTAGEKKISLKVAPQTGELVTTNNEVSTFVTVLDGGLKVLYLNGALQPDVKFLRRSLDASPDMNVELRTIDARKPETRPKDFDELFQPGKFDVYILGDLDASAFTEQELAALAATVERGAGLIMLGGFHSFGPGGYAATPLAKVLPVEMNRLERQNFGEAIRSELHLPEDSKPVMRPTAHRAVAQHHAIGAGGRQQACLGGAAGARRRQPLGSRSARRHGPGRDGRWSSAIDRARLRAGPRAGLWRRFDMALGPGGLRGGAQAILAASRVVARAEGSIDRQLGVGQPRRAPFQPRRPRRVHDRCRAIRTASRSPTPPTTSKCFAPTAARAAHACGTRRAKWRAHIPRINWPAITR